MTGDAPPKNERGTVAAWAVHLFTASGIVVAFLALLAVERQQPREALLWLLLALAIDGVDGTFARAAKVKERLPRIDGDALDLVIDYTTYVLIPALLIWHGAYLPSALALPLLAAVLVSSLYVFARRDMKTEDGYFRGFPGLWNVVALYFVVTDPGATTSAIVVVVLVLMTFAPVHVPHPFRVRDYGWLLPAIALLWAVTTAALLVPGIDNTLETVLIVASMATALVMIAMGLIRTARGPRAVQ